MSGCVCERVKEWESEEVSGCVSEWERVGVFVNE